LAARKGVKKENEMGRGGGDWPKKEKKVKKRDEKGRGGKKTFAIIKVKGGREGKRGKKSPSQKERKDQKS